MLHAQARVSARKAERAVLVPVPLRHTRRQRTSLLPASIAEGQRLRDRVSDLTRTLATLEAERGRLTDAERHPHLRNVFELGARVKANRDAIERTREALGQATEALKSFTAVGLDAHTATLRAAELDTALAAVVSPALPPLEVARALARSAASRADLAVSAGNEVVAAAPADGESLGRDEPGPSERHFYADVHRGVQRFRTVNLDELNLPCAGECVVAPSADEARRLQLVREEENARIGLEESYITLQRLRARQLAARRVRANEIARMISGQSSSQDAIRLSFLLRGAAASVFKDGAGTHAPVDESLFDALIFPVAFGHGDRRARNAQRP